MNKLGKVAKRAKSKTYWWGAMIMASPFLYENFSLLQDYLGEYYKIAFFAMGFITMTLRELTKEPVDNK